LTAASIAAPKSAILQASWGATTMPEPLLLDDDEVLPPLDEDDELLPLPDEELLPLDDEVLLLEEEELLDEEPPPPLPPHADRTSRETIRAEGATKGWIWRFMACR
jgi:hypothetical protein